MRVFYQAGGPKAVYGRDRRKDYFSDDK